jgi:DNA-nicking Smr family endonuclease
MGDKSSSLSDEDKDLWESFTEDIKPIDKNSIGDEQKNSLPVRKKRQTYNKSTTVPSSQNNHELSHGNVDDIDRKNARRFKQGKMNIDARIDLHGMTQTQAHQALHDFILHNYHEQNRNLLIVTGKGNSNPRKHWNDPKSGILKEMVPKWLNESDIRPIILSFSYATQRDGGQGALYVLLKRKRP